MPDDKFLDVTDLDSVRDAVKSGKLKGTERLKAKVQSKRQKAEQLGQRALWGRGKLASDEDAERVRALKAGGKSVRAIAAETGLSKSQVARLLSRAA